MSKILVKPIDPLYPEPDPFGNSLVWISWYRVHQVQMPIDMLYAALKQRRIESHGVK